MKLPETEYGPVQQSSSGYARIDQAQREALGIVAAGFTAFGREMVRTQSQKAAAQLQAGLADLEGEIERTPYLTTQQVRDALGGSLDSLDPETRKQLTRQALDMRTGELVETDRDDVPMYSVAEAIYEKRAKDLVKATSSTMTVGQGWQAEFEARAGEDVTARKARLAQGQFRSMLADYRKTQQETIESYVRAGNWAAATQLVAGSKAFEPAEKEQLVGAIELARQARPMDDLVLKGITSTADVVEAGKLIERLESGEGLDRMEEKERIDRKHELERLVGGYERAVASAAEHAFDAADDAAQDMIVDALTKARGRPLPFALVPQRGQASPKMREHLYKIIEGTQKNPEGPKTDLAVYSKLNGLARSDTRAFVAHDLLQYVAAGKLSQPDFRHFSDLQRTLKSEGADSPKYSGFFGAQEEVYLELRRHGFHFEGKDTPAERDALAVGYVERETNRALQAAAVAKARSGDRDPLTSSEQTAIIQPLVAKLVAAKAWKAEAKGSGIESDYSAPVRESTARRGKGVDPEAQKRTFTELQAWQGDIGTGWKRSAGGRTLTPREEVEIFDLIQAQGAAIKAALEKKGKPSNSTAVADMAVRAYLQGAR